MSHLQLSTEELLHAFGKGIGMTGAGSVAALSALSASQMLVSVCKLTLLKDTYKAQHEEAGNIRQQLENDFLPQLQSIFNKDSEIVGRMLKYRIQRDKAEDDALKAEYSLLAMAELEKATDNMMELCRICLDIIPRALYLYNSGLKSARGDSGVALSNLLSAGYSGLYTALVNIQSAKKIAWTAAKNDDIETYFGRLHEYQYIFFGKLTSIYNKVRQ